MHCFAVMLLAQGLADRNDVVDVIVEVEPAARKRKRPGIDPIRDVDVVKREKCFHGAAQEPDGDLTHVFPQPEALAAADLTSLGMPRSRAATLSAVAAAVLADTLFDATSG